MRRLVFRPGRLQIFRAALASALAPLWLGQPERRALIIGFCLALVVDQPSSWTLLSGRAA